MSKFTLAAVIAIIGFGPVHANEHQNVDQPKNDDKFPFHVVTRAKLQHAYYDESVQADVAELKKESQASPREVLVYTGYCSSEAGGDSADSYVLLIHAEGKAPGSNIAVQLVTSREAKGRKDYYDQNFASKVHEALDRDEKTQRASRISFINMAEQGAAAHFKYTLGSTQSQGVRTELDYFLRLGKQDPATIHFRHQETIITSREMSGTLAGRSGFCTFHRQNL